MSVDSRRGVFETARGKLAACALAAMFAVGFTSAATVSAQDASPVPAECVAPELPPGTPTPMEEASPEAMEGMDMASPVAEEEVPAEEASPEPEVQGTPAEGAEADEITAAAENLIGCINGGDYLGAAALMTENFLLEELGGLTNPYDVPLFLEGFMFAEASVSDPMTYEDGSVSANVTYMGSQYQLIGWTFHFVDVDGTWKVDSTTVFTPEFEGDAAVVGVNFSQTDEDGDGVPEYAITPNVETVAQSEVLVLHGINAGTEDHEIAVAILPEGADPLGLLDGSIAEEDIEFVGQIELAPGEEGDLVILNPPVGVMTLVCFFPGPDGAPHAANGMVSQLEVTAAE